MADIEDIIRSISLPLPLPNEAFVTVGKDKQLPDMDMVIKQLPPQLLQKVNWDATAVQSRFNDQSIIILPLLDGSKLKIRIEGRSIVDLSTRQDRG